jgi:hypothetical protein
VLQSGEDILEVAKTCERCRDAREFKNTCWSKVASEVFSQNPLTCECLCVEWENVPVGNGVRVLELKGLGIWCKFVNKARGFRASMSEIAWFRRNKNVFLDAVLVCSVLLSTWILTGAMELGSATEFMTPRTTMSVAMGSWWGQMRSFLGCVHTVWSNPVRIPSIIPKVSCTKI